MYYYTSYSLIKIDFSDPDSITLKKYFIHNQLFINYSVNIRQTFIYSNAIAKRLQIKNVMETIFSFLKKRFFAFGFFLPLTPK